LTEAQYLLLVELVDRYLAAGNADPGMVAIRSEDRRRLAERYPDLMPSYLREEQEDS
jgi:hypothetical protein